MIKWIKHKLRKIVYSEDAMGLTKDLTLRHPINSSNSLNSQGLNFRIYKASGGTVIETNIYDQRKDRHFNNLYVVTDDQDLGAEINKIITIEGLRG